MPKKMIGLFYALITNQEVKINTSCSRSQTKLTVKFYKIFTVCAGPFLVFFSWLEILKEFAMYRLVLVL